LPGANPLNLRFGIGQPVRRVEDRRFLTGRGRYVDDLNLPRQAYGVALMSPHAHALIRAIDTRTAEAMPGVLCVLTGADLARDGIGALPPSLMPEDIGGPKGFRTLRPLLAVVRVRHVGERVAFIVADTRAQALDAADAVVVDYDPLPAVVDVADAVAAGAPLLWSDCPTGNVSFTLSFGDAAKTEAAFAAATHRVGLTLKNNRLAASPIEPRAMVGVYDFADDTYTLHNASQNPHGNRAMLARAVFNVPETRVRVVSPDVGGGFGLKGNLHPEEGLVLWASRRCGRPVKWTATRAESLAGDHHARDQVIDGEMALDSDGRILAVRAKALHAVGAYVAATAVIPLYFSMRFIPNVYDIATVHLETKAVFVNSSTVTSYRGAGRPEAAYFIERLIDKAARVIGIDPVELRRRNFIRAAAMPYTTPTQYVYDSGDFARVLDRCLKAADWQGFAARTAQSRAKGVLRGRALSYYIEQGGNFNDRMEIRFDPGGTATIVAGTHSHGQGHATTYAQLLHQWLGLPFDSIRFVQGDTDAVPFGRGTFAARSSMVGGAALKAAAETIIEKAKRMAALLLEAAEADLAFADGAFHIAGTDRRIALPEVAKAFYRAGGITNQVGVGLEAGGTYAGDPPNHPNGCHICELEVDPETGVVAIDRYHVVDDAGTLINPLICEGQVHGGLAQGIGQALLEEIVYAKDSGQLLTGSFMDYAMPRAADVPRFKVAFEEVPCLTNPLGVKGIGEAGAVASPPTVINAILDALNPLGVTDIDMPATPLRIWTAIERARRAAN
jgi:carbon-monoxide dehydrogenase large subunit